MIYASDQCTFSLNMKALPVSLAMLSNDTGNAFKFKLKEYWQSLHLET